MYFCSLENAVLEMDISETNNFVYNKINIYEKLSILCFPACLVGERM